MRAYPRNFVLLTCHRMGFYGLTSLAKRGFLPKAIITTGPTIQHKKGLLQNVNHVDWIETARSMSYHNVFEVQGKTDLKVRLEELQPDLVVALGWFEILPKEIYDLPTHGTVLLHPSLLPEYRGGAPMTWQIIEGKKRTGATLFYLDDGIDNGDIVAQVEDEIKWDDTIKSLADRLYKKGGELLADHIEGLLDGTAPRAPQDESKAFSRPMRTPEDGKFDPSEMTVIEARDFIRAQTHPYPGAYVALEDGREITIWAGIPLVGESDFSLKCKDGRLDVIGCQERIDRSLPS